MIWELLFLCSWLGKFNDIFSPFDDVSCFPLPFPSFLCLLFPFESPEKPLNHSYPQVMNQETSTFKSKLELYFNTYVNIVDTFATAIALIGFILRFFDVTWEVARVLYCVNFVTFSFRLYRVYFVSGYLGPKIIMIKRMVSSLPVGPFKAKQNLNKHTQARTTEVQIIQPSPFGLFKISWLSL